MTTTPNHSNAQVERMTASVASMSEAGIRERLASYRTAPALGTFQRMVIDEADRRGITEAICSHSDCSRCNH